jgi:large subunit ribosomal protein L10
MAKNKAQKQDIINSLTEKMDRAKSVIFANFNQLGVKENEELRNKLKAENSEYYVSKKTLLDKVVKERVEGISSREYEGQLAAVFGYGDEVVPAKILDGFMKIKGNEKKMQFVGGILENKALSAAEVQELAKLPSKPELYARLVGSINAPVSGFVNALAGNMRNLVYVLKAIEEKKA